MLWVGSLGWAQLGGRWAQLGGSAVVGHTWLIFAGLVHRSVASCQVLWGMAGLRWLSWVTYPSSTWPLMHHWASPDLFKWWRWRNWGSASGREHAKPNPDVSWVSWGSCQNTHSMASALFSCPRQVSRAARGWTDSSFWGAESSAIVWSPSTCPSSNTKLQCSVMYFKTEVKYCILSLFS